MLQLQKNPANVSNLLGLVQQFQQLQFQQKAAATTIGSLSSAQAASLMNELRLQQEALLSQLTASNKTSGSGGLVQQQPQPSKVQPQQQQRAQFNDPTVIDPAILDAGLTSNASQSIWGDMPSMLLYSSLIVALSQIEMLNNLFIIRSNRDNSCGDGSGPNQSTANVTDSRDKQ